MFKMEPYLRSVENNGYGTTSANIEDGRLELNSNHMNTTRQTDAYAML